MSLLETGAGGLELDRLQRWMQSIIIHPGGVSSGVASREARRNIDLDLGTVETIVAPSATLSGEERLGIYWRSYHARLLECFREMFPALFRALGEDLFNLFALDYLQRYPPRSYTLDHLAHAFAEHLAETRPDANAPPGEREDWPDFIVELASLEWAFLKIYDGPGVEGLTALRVHDVLPLELERIPRVRPVPVPCLHVFAFRYPVHTYMLAVRRGKRPEIPTLATTFVAATRKEYRVRLYELTKPEYLFLTVLDGAESVGEALSRIRNLQGFQPTLSTIQNWLCDWTVKGFLASIQVPNGDPAEFHGRAETLVTEHR